MIATTALGKDLHREITTARTVGQGKAYATSTEYINDILKTNLTAESNVWAVLANAGDDMDDRMPLLITANIGIDAINRALRVGITSNDFSTRIALDPKKGPRLRGKGFVVIYKSGAIYSGRVRYCTLGNIFQHTEIPTRPETEPPLVYLKPYDDPPSGNPPIGIIGGEYGPTAIWFSNPFRR